MFAHNRQIVQKNIHTNCSKIYIEKNGIFYLLHVATPCCHNALEPGPEPVGDPLDEAGGHCGSGGVDTFLQLCHIGRPLLARHAVNVVPDTVVEECKIKAGRWPIPFSPKLPPFLISIF